MLAAVAERKLTLELGTIDLCFLIALYVRGEAAGLTAFTELQLEDVFAQASAAVAPEAEQLRRRATHTIQRLRDQRLLARVDGQGVVRAGELALSRLATGIVVLIFLLVHLSDFKFFDEVHKTGLRHQSVADYADPFTRAVGILKDPITAIVYFVGSLVLAYHVWHGFESAFQTLGLNHPKYMPLVKTVSLVFALTVGIGFASFPFWALAFN